MIGSVEHNSHTGLMWNLALDGNGQPMLPGTSSCGTPCRPVAQVNSDGTYMIHQECSSLSLHLYYNRPDMLLIAPAVYAMAQASKGVLPRDANGPWGKRLGVSVGGSLNWGLRVGAYVTGRANAADWSRYSLVVLNWCVRAFLLCRCF